MAIQQRLSLRYRRGITPSINKVYLNSDSFNSCQKNAQKHCRLSSKVHFISGASAFLLS